MNVIYAVALFWQLSSPTTPDLYYLKAPQVCDGQHCTPEHVVGGLYLSSGEYFAYDYVRDKWAAKPSAIPKEAPKPPEKPKPEVEPFAFGVTRDRLGALYRVNGREASAEQAKAALLTDDSEKPRLTAIGLPTPLQVPALLAAQVLFQEYPANHWSIKDFNLDQPALVLQTAAGKVLAVQDAGKIDFDALSSALRIPTPAPPLDNPTPVSPQPVEDNSLTAWLIVGGIVAFILWRKQ